jgi:hypothetical protein
MRSVIPARAKDVPFHHYTYSAFYTFSGHLGLVKCEHLTTQQSTPHKLDNTTTVTIDIRVIRKKDKFVLKKQLTQMNLANNRRIRREDA